MPSQSLPQTPKHNDNNPRRNVVFSNVRGWDHLEPGSGAPYLKFHWKRGEVELFKKKIEDISPFLWGHWNLCFGLLVTGWIPRLPAFSLTYNGFLRFTSGAVPVALLAVSAAAEPFRSTYLQIMYPQWKLVSLTGVFSIMSNLLWPLLHVWQHFSFY